MATWSTWLDDTRAHVASRVHGLEPLVQNAMSIPGWVVSRAAREIATRSYGLRDDPVIVEIGAFMGRSSALLAGARRRRGTGKVHVVDPFDCSGDEFSIPHYKRLLEGSDATTLEGAFRHHMLRLGLEPWIEVHKGTSFQAIEGWKQPIDLLLLDGDQSPDAARESFELWTPFLRENGQLIMNNAGEREYAEGHDGNYRVAKAEVIDAKFYGRRVIDHTLFANRR